MIDRWLSLPVPALVLTLTGFYSASALLLIYLCFGRATGAWVQSFKGVVAPFIGGIVVILEAKPRACSPFTILSPRLVCRMQKSIVPSGPM